MITKFEKRVVAGIMSAMMCFSMAQLPMESVKAENVVEETVVSEVITVDNEIMSGRENITEIKTQGEKIRYVFKPEKTGNYCFYTKKSGYITLYEKTEYGEDFIFGRGSTGSVGKDTQLQAGKIYYVDISCYSDSEVGTVTWGVEEELDIAVGDYEVEISKQNHPMACYRFVPEKSGLYGVKCQGVWIDLETSDSGRGGFGGTSYINLDAGEECHIRISYSEYGEEEPGKVSWSIVEANFPEMNLGETYQQPSNSEKMYQFIPEQSGRYVVSASTYMGINVYDSKMYSLGRYFQDYRINLNAGQTYYMNMDCYYGDTEWRMDRVEEIDIQSDTVYTTNVGQIADYRFVPQETGTYELSFKTPGKCQGIYDSNMNKVSGYGTRVFLTAGQTYYFSVKAIEEATDWKVEAMKTSEGYVYDIKEDDTIEILGYQGEESTISIPETIDGKEVTGIGEGAFWYNKIIEEVIIPASINEIAHFAFYSSNLQKIEFADGSRLKTIGNDAFEFCGGLSSIVIPNGVESIGIRAFGFTGLTEIEIPDSVIKVGSGLFRDCNLLKAVRLGKNLNKISDFMFAWCSNLTQVDFAEKSSVTKIEYDAFVSCTSLQDIQIPDSVKSMGYDSMKNTAWYDNQADGVMYINQVLYGYKGEMPEDTEISVQEGTTVIAESAFQGKENLMGIEFSNGITTIGERAFFDCASLKSITIPESVTEIGGFAFGYVRGNENDGELSQGNGFWGYVKKIEDFTVYGVPGSEAQRYAEENGFEFVSTVSYTKGDVNNDGSVDSADLRLVLRAVCGKTELTAEQQEAANVEGSDNVVDSQDMRKILQFICGKIPEL